jgi:signal transduction histidine kinase
MRRLAGTLLRAQDEERRRIARELHDSTGQNLVVAGLLADQIRRAAPSTCDSVVNDLNEVLQRSILEVRTVSYLLHPPMLDDAGLSLALKSFANGFSKRTGLLVDFDLPDDLERLPPDVELVLFRVVQEALTNVWRHSGSATARIRIVHRLAHDGKQVILTVEDAGKGISESAAVLSSRRMTDHRFSGLGISGMRERLRQIGGLLEIDSTVGQTVIRAIVGLNNEAIRSARTLPNNGLS